MEVYVKVNKQFLIEELYRLKKEIPVEEEAARMVLQEILQYVNTATPLEQNKLPKMRGLRG
jgi:hypothetical protein